MTPGANRDSEAGGKPEDGALRELELSPEQMHRMLAAAAERIVAHISALGTMPACGKSGGLELARRLVEPLPETGAPFEPLLDKLFEELVPPSFNTAGPGYLAYIPGGGLFHAAVADLIANSVNRFVGVFLAAPALAQLEANVTRWFCEIAGYSAGSGGLLTSGGSMANLIALITARRERLPENFLRGTLYTSDQTHHSVARAAVLAGFPAANVREISTDGAFRLRVDALRTRVAADRRDGFTPFLIVGNAGTTNTGAVDDLAALADMARDEGLWLHVDGAYGGFFMLTGRGRAAMAGIERADSITLDPHKGLFLPYGTGALLARDAGSLRRTHSHFAHYLPKMQNEPDLVDFTEISPELSRDFRGLRVWLPMKMHGAGVFRRALDEKLDLARWAADELRGIESVEIVAEPHLSLVAFRLAPPHVRDRALDDLNRRWLEAINARRRVFLTGTQLSGRFALRICVLSFRTHIGRMREGMDDIRAAAVETLRGAGGPA